MTTDIKFPSRAGRSYTLDQIETMLIIVLFSSFYELKKCILRSAHDMHSTECSDSSMESLDKYLSTLSVNTLNLMCNEYEDESNKCQSIPKLAKGVKYSRALNIIDGFSTLLMDPNDKN